MYGGSEGAKAATEAAQAQGVAEDVEHRKRNSMTPVISAALREGDGAPFTLFMAPVKEDIPVWREMDFTKFVAMLQIGDIFLPTVAMLHGPLEGSYAQGNENLSPWVNDRMLPAFSLTEGTQ